MERTILLSLISLLRTTRISRKVPISGTFSPKTTLVDKITTHFLFMVIARGQTLMYDREKGVSKVPFLTHAM